MPKINVELDKSPYTPGGPIATGIMIAFSKLGDQAKTINLLEVRDTETKLEPCGFGIKFTIYLAIPELIPDEITHTFDYFGAHDSNGIGNFIANNWRIAVYREAKKLRTIADKIQEIAYPDTGQ